MVKWSTTLVGMVGFSIAAIKMDCRTSLLLLRSRAGVGVLVFGDRVECHYSDAVFWKMPYLYATTTFCTQVTIFCITLLTVRMCGLVETHAFKHLNNRRDNGRAEYYARNRLFAVLSIDTNQLWRNYQEMSGRTKLAQRADIQP